MKKIISILLVVAIISCLAIPAFAQESEEPQYGTVKVEYSDSRGSIEKLEVMVLDDYVYANVDSFSIRLGYCYEQKENVVSIYTFTDLWGDQTPALALHFRIGDTTVSYNPLCGIEIEYTAPAPCVQNDRGIWVPLSYTLTLLGGSRNIAGDVLVIQMPSHNILSIAAMITNNGEALSFDWTDDFGYSETVTSVMDGAGRVVTLFSGLLEFDGRAWSSFVDWNAFDKKFGKTLATMLCTNSTDELKESIEEIELLEDVFDSDGALGSVLQTQKIQIDSNVDTWKTICEEQLEKLKTGSGTLPQYNMAYQQYERATKEQDLFSAVGADRVIHIQEELSSATNVLDKAAKIGYVVSCLEEFQQRDSFQATVLKDYFATRKDTEELPNATANAIADYASSNIVEYTAKKFCEEHLLEILVDETGLDALMGAPANILLLAWDIMSETIPFYSDGLASVESREISNYAQQVQNDAFENINTLISSLRADSASLSPEECVQLAEYCYVYLKACYVARSSAIESLDNVSEETQDILEGSINKENEINRKISKYLSILSRAEAGNSCYILGFLPENNNELLNMYSDDALMTSVVDADAENGTMNRKLTQIDVKDSEGNLITQYSFQYSEKGRMVGVINNDYQHETEILHYDGDRLTRKTSGLIDYYYTYDGDGRLVRMHSQDGLRETVYEYDSEGKLILETSRYDIGEAVTEYSYDSGGLLVRTEEICREMDDYVEKYVTTYCYDSQKRLVETVSQNDDIQTKSIYSYDLNGKLTGIHRTGKDFDEQQTFIDPFVIIETDNASIDYHSLSILVENDLGDAVCHLHCENPRLLFASDGYLAQVISIRDKAWKSTRIYEFYYDDVKAQVRLSEDAMIDAYMKALLQYPEGAEYTLYDIDKDGLSELIVHSGEYSVHVFAGSDAVLCGSFYPASYDSDAVYASDGNGIIIHSDGSKKLNSAIVSLYKLTNNILTEEETVITYDQVSDYLKQYSQITDFYPVSDHAFLKRKLA